MKLLPVVIVSLLVGAGVGVGLAAWDVGEVQTELFPPAAEAPAAPAGAASGPADKRPVGPIVEVPEDHYDFGTMQRGMSESHEFVFKNTGDAPLQLEVGRTTCKCTLGEVTDRPIAPGESVPVRMEWVAKNPPGAFRQSATVHTNDPRRPSIELMVEGMITEAAGLQPGEFIFGRISTDEAAEAHLYLAAFEDTQGDQPVTAEVRMSDTTANPERFRFTVEPVAVDELPMEGALSGVKITAEAGPGLPIGAVSEWVTIVTNLPKKNADGEVVDTLTVQAPLIARVVGDVSVHGANWSNARNLLNLGKVSSAEGREAKLLISYKGEHAAGASASLESADPEWLGVEFGEPEQVRDGVYHQRMTVRIPPGRPAVVRSGEGEENGGIGEGDARLRLRVTHPTSSELDVRVRFVIAE